ncbi:unnamed protein product [Sphenostylis stenocarpa]|uniref:Uncharacterized protein n=1 Tax=Sphenostylis stenocarpa TaxID=92480 RepID=A0AA86TEG6_9FABA|nr:unnamed protein product [Sphenostylis stenocarpa]
MVGVGRNWEQSESSGQCSWSAIRPQKAIRTESIHLVEKNEVGNGERGSLSKGLNNTGFVITVAHRIPTVIDTDLVLVLDEGTIAEYDDPAKLL